MAIADSQPTFEEKALLAGQVVEQRFRRLSGHVSGEKQHHDAAIHDYRPGKLQHIRLGQGVSNSFVSHWFCARKFLTAEVAENRALVS